MSSLILKRAPIGDNQDDYDVLENGVIVGRIFTVPTAPPGRPWMWASGHSAATVKGAGKEPWRAFRQPFQGLVPAGGSVLVLADRGLDAKWLFEDIRTWGWHPLLRLNQGGTFGPHGWYHFVPLAQRLAHVGRRWRGRGTAVATAGSNGPFKLRGNSFVVDEEKGISRTDGSLIGTWQTISFKTIAEGLAQTAGAGAPPYDYAGAGTELVVAPTPAGRLGMMICFEHAFPDVATALALRGAQILVIPSAVPFGYEHLLTLRTRARAQDNQVFAVGSNLAGTRITKTMSQFGVSLVNADGSLTAPGASTNC